MKIGVDLNLLFGPNEQGGRFFDDFVKIGDFNEVFSSAGKTEQLFGQFGTILYRLFNVFDLFIARMLGIRFSSFIKVAFP